MTPRYSLSFGYFHIFLLFFPFIFKTISLWALIVLLAWVLALGGCQAPGLGCASTKLDVLELELKLTAEK
jgi:hypothetical protein